MITLPAAANTRVCYATLDDCAAAWPAELTAWLAAGEERELARLRDQRRRQQWLAGRWLAKGLICELVERVPAASIDILTRNAQAQGDRPRVWIDRRETPLALSISHTERGVLAAVSAAEITLGIDLADEVPSSAAFINLWFSPRERQWIAANPHERTRLVWAIKEAVYKAAHAGERWDPRDVAVAVTSQGYVCRYRRQPLAALEISTHQIDRQLAVIASLPKQPSLTAHAAASTTRSVSTSFESRVLACS